MPNLFQYPDSIVHMHDILERDPNLLIENLQRVLLPVDGSELSQRAATVAFEFCRLTGATLYILHVVNLGMVQQISTMIDADADEVLQRYITHGLKLLESFKERALEFEIEVELIVDKGLPSDKIVQIANERHVNLIVMGASGATGGRSVVLGSSTDRVVRRARCPVLVVK
mgnify:CR=1 FL=1